MSNIDSVSRPRIFVSSYMFRKDQSLDNVGWWLELCSSDHAWSRVHTRQRKTDTKNSKVKFRIRISKRASFWTPKSCCLYSARPFQRAIVAGVVPFSWEWFVDRDSSTWSILENKLDLQCKMSAESRQQRGRLLPERNRDFSFFLCV